MRSPFTLATTMSQPQAPRSYWVIADALLAGAYPGSPDVEAHQQRTSALWTAGMRTYVNLMEESERNNLGQPFTPYQDCLQDFATRDRQTVQCLRFPIQDLGIPSVAEMKTILDAVDGSLAAGRPVYVHCFGGVGRTATVVCCWLLRHGLASQDNVAQVIAQLRQADADTRMRPAPETSKQVKFVAQWDG